ncbi:MAG: hypothetical protein P794_10070 [Epsilonproteobacteria bacterium (ex Lamellibrachia satsuma)]|nr:MAG: hypothetical protein P794_10070 [Epsilonproteobacteria bacterium (ex Lamellibrachia satsuma)]
MQTVKYILTCFLTFPLYLSSAPKVENSSIKTAVIFNTLCAKCHEGECSGRLSFDTGSKVAGNHIKHYAGDINISKEEIKEFFTLLNHMKTECIVWMPDAGKRNMKKLSLFALPSGKGYFVPLGSLQKGKYSLEIKLKEDIHFRIEVLSDKFEHFLDISACPNCEKEPLQFTIDRPANTFLRIRSRKTFQIIDLNVKKDE